MSLVSHTKYPTCQAGEVARSASGDSTLIKGRLFKQPEPGSFPAFSASGQDVWHSTYRQEGKAIILSAVGARCGKCFFAQGKWSAIANTHIIWPNYDLVDPEYLFYLLNNEDFWIRGGSAQPFVKVRASLEQQIPLPPLPEQRRIVARIKECMERVEEIERLRTEAVKEAEATLPSFLSGTFDELSNKYPVVEIGHVALETRYGTSRKCSTNGKGLPILRIPNVIHGTISFDDLKYCQLDMRETSRILLKDGDLLFVRTNGSRDLVGRCAVFEAPSNETFGFASYLIRVRLDPRTMLPHFLAFFLNSTHGRTALNQRRRTSAGQYNINSQNLRTIEVPAPPLHIQEALVSAFRDQASELLRLCDEMHSAGTEHTHLRDAILRKAFAGEL